LGSLGGGLHFPSASLLVITITVTIIVIVITKLKHTGKKNVLLASLQMWKAKYAIFRQSMASASGVLMMQQRILRFIAYTVDLQPIRRVQWSGDVASAEKVGGHFRTRMRISETRSVYARNTESDP